MEDRRIISGEISGESDEEVEEDFLQLIIVGNSSVGKTSIIRRYVNGTFSEEYKATIGVDFAFKTIKWKNKNIKLQVWDVAGQERFGSLTHVFYSDAVGALMVFDLNNVKSFNDIEIWNSDIKSNVEIEEDVPIPCLLIGNKCDVLKGRMEVEDSLFESACSDHENILKYYETSAKSGKNIENAMNYLIGYIMEKIVPFYFDDGDTSSFSLNSIRRSPRKGETPQKDDVYINNNTSGCCSK